MGSFYMRRSQKCKKDSQLKQLFALLGSACIKAACKHVGEIETRSGVKTDKLIGPDHVSKMSNTESNLSIDDCVARHT